ncbi:MAG: class I SAM-dependent methyltransferase, partial [Erysipelotrichaceae bacterium]|nr:class I SAM-dependent methyltransferase [Erysipelotrichaceae bacterium]
GAIFDYAKLNEGSEVLEIGCGTGKATGAFLEKGCHVTALEPGENLAEIAQHKFKDKPGFILKNEMFQDFSAAEESFDLIYAASSFHWIEEGYGYKRVFELLKAGGSFARFRYHANAGINDEKLFSEIQSFYDRYYPSTGKFRPGFTMEEALKIADKAKAYGFTDTGAQLFEFDQVLDADDYMKLLMTYPDHMRIDENNRHKLFDGIRSAIIAHGGAITVHYVTDLELARKLERGSCR